MNETVEQDPITTVAGEQQEARTFTRDEVNSIVADCLNRERAKYADYDALKEKADQFDATKAQLDALIAANDRREMRARVSAATGVPVELLTGDTEEACNAQAQVALKFARPLYPNVRDSTPRHAPSAPGVSDFLNRSVKHEPRPYPYY